MIDIEFTTETLVRLVRTNSVNPAMQAGAPGEAEIAAYVADVMQGLGLEVRRHEPVPDRVSVVGVLRGTDGGRSLMLNAHHDTVGVEGMVGDPFGAAIRDGRLYGRGAYDMKGSLAACLAAARALAAGPALSGDVLVAAVADEEDASLGTRDAIEHYAVDGAIVTEPTGLRVCLAHKGFVWIDVTVHGRAAHGSRPDLGIDANMLAGRFMARLDALARDLAERPLHPLLGVASLHVAQVQGGSGPSTYAERCRLRIERRTLPGETEEGVLAELHAVLQAARREEPRLEATLESALARAPFEADPEGDVVRATIEATEAVLGAPPALVGEMPWMDSALLATAGVDTVVIGPAGSGAHGAEEWVELDSVYRLAEILVRAARRYCA
ncbi:MAG: M20/M25/M40 family metallo-hydrolase [Longimicrobiales bacterium]